MRVILPSRLLSPCFVLSPPSFSFCFIYFFITPTSPSPSALPFSVCATTCFESVYLDCLCSQLPVSVSRMKARWTSSFHCYLPADSGKPPSLPSFLAWQKYLPLFRETCICCCTSSLSCNISGKLCISLLLRLVEVSRVCNGLVEAVFSLPNFCIFLGYVTYWCWLLNTLQ
jgi:hypothetical protein